MPNVKVALVGCGNWGKNLARVLAEQEALAVICDERPKVAAPHAKRLGVPLVPNLDQALDTYDFAAVVIASPAETHYEIAVLALNAGKDVCVEKPIALDVTQAEVMVARADASNRILMVGHLLHYHPVFQKVKAMIANGDLGALRYVYSNRLNMGSLRSTENVLWSFAPHDISMILALVGNTPTSVEATGHTFLQDGIEDIVNLRLGFESGAAAHVFVSWLNPFKEQKLTIVGETGMLVFDDTKPWEDKLVLYRHSVEWKEETPRAVKAEGEKVIVAQGEPLHLEVEHFLNCVEKRTAPRTDGNEGIAVLQVLQAAQSNLDRQREMRANLNGH